MLAFSGSSFSAQPLGSLHEGLQDAGSFGLASGRGGLNRTSSTYDVATGRGVLSRTSTIQDACAFLID
ncbi:hypothetical protein D7Z54_22550 [Salibacterium salarium]|uniref:Uncharacterized protein n=1 Tax=Salibacterium salarium TaxID=284579 RepID=A0A3R9QQF5_9BACI|nr:hypothetical protein D7Z54_22550 [Salibacterium salarium]